MNPKFYLFFLCIFIWSCEEDDDATADASCGPGVETLCYAHNWDEFEMLKNFHDGKAIYNHEFIAKNGTYLYYYKAKLDKICNTSNLHVSFANTVKLGSSVTYLADVLFNNVPERVTLNNVNGIITGSFNKKLNLTIPTTIEIVSLIVLSDNPLPNDATKWFNENIQSFGFTAKYQEPK
jgi:hypothetical protein